MELKGVERRLAAVLATDMVGYSRLMEADEAGTLAACYAHMGRLDEARTILKRLTALTPVVVPTANPFRDPEHIDLFVSGLRLAAGEET